MPRITVQTMLFHLIRYENEAAGTVRQCGGGREAPRTVIKWPHERHSHRWSDINNQDGKPFQTMKYQYLHFNYPACRGLALSGSPSSVSVVTAWRGGSQEAGGLGGTRWNAGWHLILKCIFRFCRNLTTIRGRNMIYPILEYDLFLQFFSSALSMKWKTCIYEKKSGQTDR